MLCKYFILFAVLGYHAQGASIKQKELISITERLVNTVQAKCSANGKDDKYQEVAHAINHLSYGCWNNKIPDLNRPWKKNQQVCIENVPQVVKCITTFIEKLEPCLAPEEHFLKDFILDGYAKYSESFCENIKAVSIQDAMETNTPQCIRNFMLNTEANPHYVCYAQSKFFGQDASHEVITKSELCQDLKNVRACYERMFEEQCPNAPEIKEFTLGIMKAGLQQCSTEN